MKDTIESLVEYWTINIGGILTLIFISSLFAYVSGSKDYLKANVTIFISTFVTWLGHYLLHNYNTYNPIAWIHSHTHHSEFAHTFLGKLIEYVIVEFIFFGGGLLLMLVLYIKYKFNYYILDPYVILLWSVAVPVIHELYYHKFKLDFHRIHHEDGSTHYSPELWDITMNTRKKNIEIDNETLMVPILLGLTFLMVPFINTKYDFIKYI